MSIPYAILFGAIIAAATQIGLQIAFRWRDRYSKAHRLRAGLRSEIRGIVELSNDGPFEERLQAIETAIDTGSSFPFFLFVDPKLPLDPFLAAAIPDLGLLPEEDCARVLRFYRRLKFIRLELLSLQECKDLDEATARALVQNARKSWHELQKLASEIID